MQEEFEVNLGKCTSVSKFLQNLNSANFRSVKPWSPGFKAGKDRYLKKNMFLMSRRCGYERISWFYGWRINLNYNLSSPGGPYVGYRCCCRSHELLLWWIQSYFLVSLGLQCFSRRNLSHIISNKGHIGE